MEVALDPQHSHFQTSRPHPWCNDLLVSFLFLRFSFLFLFFSHNKGRPQRGSREQLYLEALEESGDQFTFIIVVSLAVCGTLLLLVIVVLMVYMCHKKDKQLKGGQLTASSTSGGSSQQKAPSEGIFFFSFCFILH